MAILARSVVTLRFFGDDLHPEEISRLLGCKPTDAWPKGHIQLGMNGRQYVKKTGAWLLEAESAEPGNIDGQVSELLSQLTTDLSIWVSLAKRYQVDLFCGWFMEKSLEGVSISPVTMQALGARGIELQVDIYGPDEENTKEASPPNQAL